MTEQFQGVYSDRDGKRVVQLLSGNLFFARKYLRLNNEQRIYVSQLFLNRISNKFCNIKGSFDCFVTTNQENILIANSPFFQHMPLLKYISTELNSGHLTKIFERLIITMLRGQNEYFYSYQNIFINQISGEIVLAPFSVIGLMPLNFRTKFTKQQFMEVYQLLDLSMFEQRPDKTLIQISHKMKFRALGMMVIHCIAQKRISLIFEEDIPTDTISFEDAQILVSRLRQRFIKILTVHRLIQLFDEASNRDKIDYYYFVKRVFIDQCQNMTWKQVKQLLIPKPKSQTSDLNLYFKQVAQLKYQQQDDFARKRLQNLGIIKSESQIYLAFKLQIPRLTFSTLSDLVQREKYSSSYNWKMMLNIAKLLPQQEDPNNQQKIFEKQTPPIRQVKKRQYYPSAALKPQLYYDSEQQSNRQDFKEIVMEYFKFVKPNKTKITQQIVANCEKSQITLWQITDNVSQNYQQQKQQQFQKFEQQLGLQAQATPSQTKLSQAITTIVEKMAKHYKTNVAQVRGTKIYAIDPKMAIINQYFQL